MALVRELFPGLVISLQYWVDYLTTSDICLKSYLKYKVYQRHPQSSRSPKADEVLFDKIFNIRIKKLVYVLTIVLIYL